MNSEPALFNDPLHSTIPILPRARGARAIADLVRRIVHGLRGLSRAAVVDWVSLFFDDIDRAAVLARIGDVVDVLVEMQDIGHGTIRGERILVALPERRVVLPDGRIVALGDHGYFPVTSSEELFPEITGLATESLVEILVSSDEAKTVSSSWALEPVGRWTSDDPMPPALRKALLLCGAFDLVEQQWSIGEDNAVFLNEWFDLTPPVSLLKEMELLDESQARVVQEPATFRMVVESGPGSGKTHVACERVMSLVQNADLAPARILLLSFTRVAVAELRSRIHRRLDDMLNVKAIQIRTFDSFAALLLAAAGAGAGFTDSHDASIRAATRLMRSNDPLVAAAIGQLEHVIIDEAQDLVGDRQKMCEAILALLDPACGVTIFGDFAQSIYGYQNPTNKGSTFLAEVAQRADFSRYELARDHRTKTAALKEMFASVRRTLREYPKGSSDGYFRVREQIKGAAAENDVTGFALHPSTTRGLILTRSRRGLFTAAEELRSAGRKFRLRLPDRPARIEPWIGALLGGLPPASRVSRDEFSSAYWALSPVPHRDVEECWEILLDLDGSGRDDTSVGKVADGLVDPPLELLSDYEGHFGPLLSTIHAIKGREAERVMLLFTPAPNGNEVDWAEEARTMYVGATRASSELRTGWISPTRFYTAGEPERYWAARHDHRLIEIGLEGDLVNWADFVRSGHVLNTTDTISRIWRVSIEEPQVAAYPDPYNRLIVRVGDREGTAIGQLSDTFLKLMQSLRQVGPKAPLPEVVAGISVVGATTVVVPGRPGETSGLALMPLLGGFASIAR